MATTKLTYSDLRYWYLSELRRIKKSQYDGSISRKAKEMRAIRCKMKELRLAQRYPDSVYMPNEPFILRPWD